MKVLSLFVLFILALSAEAGSKRVQVYENGQRHWDVQSGQTLGQICQQLNNINQRSRLACQILMLDNNPEAFINKDPDRLIAGKRLWLPGSYQPQSEQNSKNYHIKTFNWGSIKTPK
ncbi:MAG: hypothetical protein OEY29_07550 [Gammaproteobacteria bacterium]|nr:hypothetical protein [Gammaproteobacteria bacterium]